MSDSRAAPPINLTCDRHHKNEEAAVAKMIRKILENICETVPDSTPAMFQSG